MAGSLALVVSQQVCKSVPREDLCGPQTLSCKGIWVSRKPWFSGMASPELPVVAWHKENTRARRRSRDGSRRPQSSNFDNPGRPRRGAVGERKRSVHVGPGLSRHVGGHSRQRPLYRSHGEILEELATKHPDRLRISNVESLPAGWERPAPCTAGPPWPQENGSCSPTQ